MRLFKQKSFKGYAFAGLAAFSVSFVYIFSKAALRVTPIFTFCFYWFLMSFLFNFSLVLSTGRFKFLFTYPRKKLRILFIIGIIEFLASFTFYKSVSDMENPAVVSFLVNTIPVFVTLMSIPLLNEKFNSMEILGILITLSGAFMLSFSGKFSWDGLLVKGAYVTLLSCVIAAIGLIMAKKNIKSLDPFFISFTRSMFLCSFYLILMLLSPHTKTVSWKILGFCAAGSFSGPFLASILQYSSFKYIDVSKQTLIQNSHGVFVVISAFIFMGILPLQIQIVGGLITIVGVTIMVFGKLYFQKFKAIQNSLFLFFFKFKHKS